MCVCVCVCVCVSMDKCLIDRGTLKQRLGSVLLFRQHYGDLKQNINYIVETWKTLLHKGKSPQTTKHMTAYSVES